jgi:hypothetical protein
MTQNVQSSGHTTENVQGMEGSREGRERQTIGIGMFYSTNGVARTITNWMLEDSTRPVGARYVLKV